MSTSVPADRWRRLVAEVVRVRPAPGAHRVAVRAALATVVPLAALAATGRLSLGVYASFGAFASVFGGAARWPGRLRLQAAAGLTLVAAVACGVAVALSPHRSWIAVPVAAGWAVAAAVASDRVRLVPRGPLLPVFAVATCAAIPATPQRAVTAVAVASLAAGFAVALGAAEQRLARGGPEQVRPDYPLPDARRQAVHAVRCGVAVALAGSAATAAGIGHPWWAMVASVAPLTTPGLAVQVVRGLHRLAGTVVGLGLAAVLLRLDLGVAALLAAVAVLQVCTELLVVRHYGTALVTITPLALLLAQAAAPQPVGTLVTDRLAETLLGVAVGVAVAVATRPRRPSGVTRPSSG